VELIVWLNGTFGAGKSSVAAEIVKLDEKFRIFDPEWVGFMLRANLQDQKFSDFQQLPSWRRLTPVVAREVAESTGQNIVAVQTVLNAEYWAEIARGCELQGLELFHVVLEAEPTTLRKRIEQDEVERDAIEWRIEHMPVYEKQRQWMIDAADLTIDTTNIAPYAAAIRLLESVEMIKPHGSQESRR
jgi:adenylylsulfate kinase-like enzyme